jgi:hypothetical protein
MPLKGIQKDQENKKPPPPPRAPARSLEATASTEPTWQEVEEVLFRFLDRAADAIAIARGKISPADGLKLIEHFIKHKDSRGWGPGALYERFCIANSNLPVERGWPAKSQAAITAEASAAKQSRSRNEEIAERLERDYGADFDALPKDERDAIAEVALRDDLPDEHPNKGSDLALYRRRGAVHKRIRCLCLAEFRSRRRNQSPDDEVRQ